MAIQNRKGPYNKFDPQKLLPGEWAVVTSGDLHAPDGLSVYMCFKAGIVKRMATYEDMVDNIDQAAGEVIAKKIKAAVSGAVNECKNATQEARSQADNAKRATTEANEIITRAKETIKEADAAAKRANEAADKIDGLLDGSAYTELENKVNAILQKMAGTITTE